jgi:predicted nucleotidyltransferase
MNPRTDLSHLPPPQQKELARSIRILKEEFERAIARGTQSWERGGKILKIILFGSYARDDWVVDEKSGYRSDFDLLIIVNHRKLTDISEYWYVAEDRILATKTIQREVNIIVHDLGEVNEKLACGEYFWADIARDGITLYELPGHPLATPIPLIPADALGMAERYFEKSSISSDNWLKMAEFAVHEGPSNDDWLNKAAFNLHQATETIYTCFLLTVTLYVPRSHNIKFLRSISEDREPRLIEAWPRATRVDRSRFELLKRAYVEARYSPHYSISLEELEWLMLSAKRLREIVEQVCREWLERMRGKAGG